jgi:hypothetical protein
MPYETRPPRRDVDPNHEQLVRALVQEFKEKSLSVAAMTASDEKAPVIIEEQMANSDRLRVYVKWAQWSGIREDHRTAAIFDAYERNFGREYARRIVIALGVTPEEAKDLGIQE